MSDLPEPSRLLPILQVGEPILRAPAADLTAEQSAHVHDLVAAMTETMRAAPGVGLAAPQIGESIRLAVIEDVDANLEAMPDGEAERMERVLLPLEVLINPTYQPVGDRMITHFEGCLSVDGYRALVARHHTVRMTWSDIDGRKQQRELSGWPARIVQHEIDHLNGVIYIDRMEPRSFMSNRNWARHWMDTSEDDICRALGIAAS